MPDQPGTEPPQPSRRLDKVAVPVTGGNIVEA